MTKAALLIVDMVHDFTHPEGLVYYAQNQEVLPRIAECLSLCRKAGFLIIFLQHRYRKDKFDKNLLNMRPNCIEGTGGEAIDDALLVDPIKDYVIPKRRYSGFFGTDLDLVLREHKIENTIIVGTKTNCCVRATATDAYYLDYHPIVVSDCVATNCEIVNRVHLEDIQKYIGDVMCLDELKQMIEKKDLT